MPPPTCGRFLGHSAVGLHLCPRPPGAAGPVPRGKHPCPTEDVRKMSTQRITSPPPGSGSALWVSKHPAVLCDASRGSFNPVQLQRCLPGARGRPHKLRDPELLFPRPTPVPPSTCPALPGVYGVRSQRHADRSLLALLSSPRPPQGAVGPKAQLLSTASPFWWPRPVSQPPRSLPAVTVLKRNTLLSPRKFQGFQEPVS